jgi:predicted alpha/beta-hydrolase family hydrolase
MTGADVLLLRPPGAQALLVLAHGAGAGMRHPFMQAVAEALAGQAIATLRYQFPYMDAGGRRPDPPAVAEAAVCVAVGKARAVAPDLPLFAGGKSFGGRMTSTAQAHAPLEGVRGLVFLGFPLHPPGKPGSSRAAHLERISVPMLFLQGTRDTLANLDLMRPVCHDLGTRATLHVVDGADHSFGVLKRSGRTNLDVLNELAAVTAQWMSPLAGDRPPAA